MDSLKEGLKILYSSCENCGHPHATHFKTSHRDEQRANPRTIKRTDSECQTCKKQRKVCKKFKPKK